MRGKVWIILVIGFFAVQLLGLSAVSGAQHYWAKSYSAWDPSHPLDTDWHDAAGCVKEVPPGIMGGGFIVAGSTDPTWQAGYPYNILIIKLDEDGTVGWGGYVRNYDEPAGGLQCAYSIDVIPPGVNAPNGPGYIIAGRIAPTFGGPYDVLVMRLDHQGRLLWAYRYDFGLSWECATCVKVDPAFFGSATQFRHIVVGGIGLTRPNFDELLVMLLDDDGHIISPPGATLYPIAAANGAWLVDAFGSAGSTIGEYILGGFTTTTVGGLGGIDAVALRLEGDLRPGISGWTNRYGLLDINLTSWDERFTCIKRIPTGFIATGGTNTPTSGGRNHMLAMELDDFGQIVWTNAPWNVNSMNDDQAYSIDETSPAGLNGYIVTGTTFPPALTDLDLVVVKLKPDLTVDWAKELRPDPGFPPMNNNDGGNCIETRWDGYIISGWTQSMRPWWDFLVCKLDRNGDIITMPDSCLQLCPFEDSLLQDSLLEEWWDPEFFEPETVRVVLEYDSLYVDSVINDTTYELPPCEFIAHFNTPEGEPYPFDVIISDGEWVQEFDSVIYLETEVPCTATYTMDYERNNNKVRIQSRITLSDPEVVDFNVYAHDPAELEPRIRPYVSFRKVGAIDSLSWEYDPDSLSLRYTAHVEPGAVMDLNVIIDDESEDLPRYILKSYSHSRSPHSPTKMDIWNITEEYQVRGWGELVMLV